jgi:hypothetical protein
MTVRLLDDASVAGAAKLTTAPSSPWASVVIGGGQVNTGGSGSMRVTVKEHRLVPPSALAVQATTVSPSAKKLPEGGAQTTVGGTRPHVLLAVTLKFTTCPPRFVTLRVMSGGQRISMQSSSAEHRPSTMTGNVQRPRFRSSSVVEQETVVAPVGKIEPDGGSQVTDILVSQRSVAPTRNRTIAPPFRSQSTRISRGHSTSGGVVSRTVTENVQAFVSTALTATQRTTIVPGLKTAPDGGKQVKTTFEPQMLMACAR